MARHPAFGYVSILALQAKVLFGIFSNRDLPLRSGVNYFVHASGWATDATVNILWSPLYTSFYGTFLFLADRTVFAHLAHRAAIVLITTALVLALARALLPPVWAWFVAAWWAIIPSHFDIWYEVHLFKAIPPLTAAVVAARFDSPRGRGAALAILVADTVLVRNEMAIAVAAFGLAAVVWDLLRLRRSEGRARSVALAYAVPLVLVALATTFFYARSVLKPPALWEAAARKHQVNVCQVYAFGYQQRHDDWTGNPWTECDELMQRDFGSPTPSMLDAFGADPSAMTEHFLWNARLAPAGLELLLFGKAVGNTIPGYDPSVDIDAPLGALLAVGAVILVGAAGVVGWRDRHFWWRAWIARRRWGWVLLGGSALSSVVVMLMQRPRPAYLLSLGVTLQILVAMAAWVLVCRAGGRRRRSIRRAEWVLPIVAVLAIAVVPPHYRLGYQHHPDGYEGQPVADQVRHLTPYRDRFAEETVLVRWHSRVTCGFVMAAPCRSEGWVGMAALDLPAEPHAEDVAGSLEEHGVDYVYVERVLSRQPGFRVLVADPKRYGWERLAGGDGWQLLARTDAG